MDNVLGEGLNLMLVGMGAVFVFLVLLVFATSLMSSLVGRFLPEPPIPVPLPVTPAPHQARVDDEQLIAVITAAIHQHRSRR